jgi:hypothetical protein
MQERKTDFAAGVEPLAALMSNLKKLPGTV